MANVNQGPASTVTANAQSQLSHRVGEASGLLFANLSTTAVFNVGEIAYTSDRGLCFWNGTSWTPTGGLGALASTLASLPSGTITGQIAFTTDFGLVSWSGTAWVSTVKDQIRLLAQGKALNVNQLGDVGVLPILNSTKWNIQAVVASNLSAGAGTSVAIGLMSATAGAAVTIVAPVILSGLVAFGGATVAYRPTVQNVSFVGTGTTIYVNCQTTAGAVCTLDVSVYGYDLS